MKILRQKQILLGLLICISFIPFQMLISDLEMTDLDIKNKSSSKYIQSPKASDESGGGYLMNTTADYSWIEINQTGTELTDISNNTYNSANITLISWSFEFYETVYDEVFVSSRGWIGFTDTDGYGHYPNEIPDYEVLNQDCIAPLWDRFEPRESEGGGGTVYFQFLSSPNRLVIEFKDMYIYDSGYKYSGSFEAILYESGVIVFQYQNIEIIDDGVIGLDHGDLTNYNKYVGLFPMESKAIEFTFQEMEPVNYSLSVKEKGEYSWIVTDCDNEKMDLIFGSTWESDFGYMANPTRASKMMINVSSIETNETHWKINYDCWNWTFYRNNYGMIKDCEDSVVFRKKPENYTQATNFTHLYPFFIPLPLEVYPNFVNLSDFYTGGFQAHSGGSEFEFGETVWINGHRISRGGQGFYNENGILEYIKFDWWNDTSSEGGIAFRLDLITPEILKNYTISAKNGDKVNYLLTKLNETILEGVYGENWEDNFGILPNPRISQKMMINYSSILTNSTHFTISQQIWNWTDRTDNYNILFDDFNDLIYRREPFNYTLGEKPPNKFPFIIPEEGWYCDYSNLFLNYSTETGQFRTTLYYDENFEINGYNIKVITTVRYDKKGFLEQLDVQFQNSSDYKYFTILEFSKVGDRAFEEYNIAVNKNDEYSWAISEYNNTFIERVLGSNWESEYGLPNNPTSLEKMKINITGKSEKYSELWQVNYSIWDWTGLHDNYNALPIQSDSVNYSIDPLNYTVSNYLPNKIPLFIPYPPEIYFEFVEFSDPNNPDYRFDFDPYTNIFEIDIDDYKADCDIYIYSEYDKNGVLNELEIKVENDTSDEEGNFKMVRIHDGSKASYIGDVNAGENYEYGLYTSKYNAPDFYASYLDNLGDRLKIGIEYISGEIPNLNYSTVIYNISERQNGLYSLANYYHYFLYDNTEGYIYNSYIGFLISTNINWTMLCSVLNESLSSSDAVIPIKNGYIRRYETSDGDINEIMYNYTSEGILESVEQKVNGKIFLCYRLNDFDYVIPENRVPFDILSPIEGNSFKLDPPSLSIDLDISKERVECMWYTIDGGLTNITFTENTTIDQIEWDKVSSTATVTLEVYVQNTIGIINKSQVVIYKTVDGPSITINSPLLDQHCGIVAPSYNLTIGGSWEVAWYSLNNGENYTISSIIGKINQTYWDTIMLSGPILIKFYANDSSGNLGFVSVTVQKDAHCPSVIITSPNENDTYENPPSLEISINDDVNIAEQWYSVQEDFEHENVSFIGDSITINETLWARVPKGYVHIYVYARDNGNNLNSTYILIQKTIEPTITPDNDEEDDIDEPPEEDPGGFGNIPGPQFYLIIFFSTISVIAISFRTKTQKKLMN